MAKYIIELEDKADENGKVFAKDFKTLCFDDYGLSKLVPYEEPKPEQEPEAEEWPKAGDVVCWINSGSGRVCEWDWSETDVCDELFSIGNCFRTREEAEFAVERLKVTAELKKFAEPEDAPWDGNRIHCLLSWNVPTKEIAIREVWSSKLAVIHFQSKETAWKAIAAVGEERIKKYYLGVKE